MKESIYNRANAECKWTRRGNTLSPASSQDQYCSNLLELPGRKEGVKEKERDPLLNHQLFPLHSHNGVLGVLQWGCTLWPRGPHRVHCVQDLGLWLDLTSTPLGHNGYWTWPSLASTIYSLVDQSFFKILALTANNMVLSRNLVPGRTEYITSIRPIWICFDILSE